LIGICSIIATPIVSARRITIIPKVSVARMVDTNLLGVVEKTVVIDTVIGTSNYVDANIV